MSVGNDALSDPRFASLNASGLVDLCNSLADYGEAGGLSRELMLQVGSFAEARFADDIEVLLAVARMYLLGGETARSRATLVRAGKRWPDESRVRPLLAHALKLLDDQRSVDDVLRDARGSMHPSAATPRSGDRRTSIPPAPSTGDTQKAAVRPMYVATPAGLPAVKMKEAPDTLPMSEAAKMRAIEASRVSERPRAPAPHDSLAPTPASGMPIVPRAPAVPRGMGDGTSSRPPHTPAPTIPQMRAITAPPTAGLRASRGPAAARVPMEEAVMRAAEARTEVGRVARRSTSELPPEPPQAPRSVRQGGVPRATRIRLLEPDDDRRRLDPYELIGEIASGGMATVFLGRLAGAGGFQRLVAIKRLHPHLEREEQFVTMFLDEARLAAGIHHPHVVPILEVGMSDAGYYLVMEFIEGDTLAGLIVRSLQRGRPMPPNVAARIVLDSLAGLHAAHQLTDGGGHYLGLVHRDCTPQNILVGIDGSARITDFGVARAASRLAITRPQQVKGKVAYLSPEQAHALELDRRSDVFTMGIVLWEALAGRPLFQADTEAATLSRLLAGHVPPVQSFVPDVTPAIDEVCRRALAHDRNRRYRTAAEMAEALERAASSEGFGGVASPRELGRYVEQVMGAEIAAQRESVRNWLAQNESSPMSRGPRSTISAGARSSTSPHMVPPSSLAPSASPSSIPERLTPITDDAPDTPPPRAEKHPRLSTTPPPPDTERTPSAAIAAGHDAPALEAEQPAIETPDEVDEGAAADRDPAEGQPAHVGASHEASMSRGPRFSLPPWLARIVSMKLSTRDGTLLVVVIVLLAIAPLAYKAHKRGISPPPAATTIKPPGMKKPAPAARPKATAAWDEGDWPLPDAGAGTPDE